MTASSSPVGERLRSLRAKANVSARELCRLADLRSSHVSLIESGAVTNARADTLSALARVLGCSLDWLVDGVGTEPAPDAVVEAVASARAARATATATSASSDDAA